MKNKSIVITLVACLVVGAVAFFGGMQYQKMQRPQGLAFGANGQRAGGRVGNGQAGQNANFRPVIGQIISSDDKSVTVKMQDGSSKIVILSDSTNIMEATSASKEALKTGQNVMVIGQTNSDGSVTAQNIQLNPQMRGFGGPQQRTQ